MSETSKRSGVGLQLKTRWHKEGKGLSLKQFARKLVAEGDTVAKSWFDNKKSARK